MTDREKLDFLLDILKESGKWSRSNDDPTGLELEFNDRLSKLMSIPTDRLVGPEEPMEIKPTYFAQKKYCENKVRVSWTDEEGKTHRTWFDKDLCKQIPIAAGCCTKMKWVLKDQEELNKLKEMAEED